jgi:hypothetical protein
LVVEDGETGRRKLILDFYSSQINGHTRLIIGFAVLMLTLVQIRQRIEFLSSWQYVIIYFAMFSTAFFLWYLSMRCLAYGMLANASIWAPPTTRRVDLTYLQQLVVEGKERVSNCNKFILVIFPSVCFIEGSEQKFGAMICIGLAIITSAFMYLLIS